jgi:predicted nucleotidyltransferase component of viral defense system
LGDLKLDFVKYRYQPIRPVQVIDGIRMLHLEDIAAMKLSAVTNRGAKKDFFDVFFLLKHYDLATMLSFFSKKYPQQELFFVLKSLTYFEDADSDIDPDMLIATEWETVKTRIAAEVNTYLKTL